ncbi:heterokaryon incompatibility protein-domain-containing protein [Truncatella angustata]|uniref:Heterokaryon incompatibility protein-domain-containing protein n=1 Tax=Truncatella angustata TaxID=152316 RepID=A0A9P8UA95_9PEZI|nr:heterokaryon incompatibility protein-domain-containing protein [Truncatella angustata]KAH6640037.1 heterokaryon incompatibility protein-domain-containing protein [Truncatella angustata]
MAIESIINMTDIYSSLPGERWARVLVLAPGNWESPLSCTLEPYDLDSEHIQPYEAISYVWGDPRPTEPISINDKATFATQSLASALQQLRLPDIDRRLWADAICINQSDLNEKGYAVTMMGSIYESASRVIVWLGTDMSGTAQTAIDVIKSFNRLVEKQLTPQQFHKAWGPLHDPDGMIKRNQLEHAVRLFGNVWFRRAWVLQEVGVAKDALLAYGSATVDFAEAIQFICAWSSYYGYHDGKMQFPGLDFKSAYLRLLFGKVWVSYLPARALTFEHTWIRKSPLLQYEAQILRCEQYLEFLDILFLNMNELRATDPRDFVFAFLSNPLSRQPDGRPIIQADYTISSSEVRRRLFSELAKKSLRFLGLVWHSSDTDLKDESSWYPDFDKYSTGCINGRYDANLSISPVFNASISAEICGNMLKISALLVDEVGSCGPVAPYPVKDNDHQAITFPKVLEQYWDLAWDHEIKCKSSGSFRDMILRFASTLLHTIDTENHSEILFSFTKFVQNKCPEIYQELLRRWPGSEKLKQQTETTQRIPFGPRAEWTIKGHRFFVSSNGNFGTGSPLVQPGDLICVIPTVQAPVIIRPVDIANRPTYRVISACYVYGLMYGHAVSQWIEDPSSLNKSDLTFV